MFETIRAMVNQKHSFLETAELLLDETAELSTEVLFSESDDSLTGDIEPVETETVTSEDDVDKDEDDDLDEPQHADDMMKVSFSTQPTPAEDDTDLLSVTFDLRSNTGADVLPVPPINAGDALEGETPSTRIPDGFAEKYSFDGIMTEAITIDGEEKPAKKTKDDKTSEEDVPEEEPVSDEENSNVTDAVLDKVAESDLEADASIDSAELRSKIQDKLDKFQKDIIGLKELVKKGLNDKV